MEKQVLNVLRGDAPGADINALANGPPFVACTNLGSGRTAVCRYNEAKIILSDQTNFVASEVARGMLASLPDNLRHKLTHVDKWLLYSDTPEKKRLKAHISASMSLISANGLQSYIANYARELVTVAGEHSSIDVISDIATKLPLASMCCLMGLPPEDADFLKGISQDLLLLTEPALSVDMISRIGHSWDAISAYFDSQINKQGVGAGTPGLLAVVANYQLDGKLIDRQEAIAQSISLLLGAHETTIGLICNTVQAAILYPEQAARISVVPNGPMAFVNEVMRFTPPSKITARVAARNIEISGYNINHGDRFIIMFDPANRDPLTFRNSLEFDALETSRQMPLSFGYGDHFCLGANLAKFQASSVLQAFIENDLIGKYQIDELAFAKSDVFRRMSSFRIVK